MSRLRTHALPIVILVFAAVAAALIWRDEPPADWLSVSAPGKPAVGETFVVEAVLREPAPAGFLHVDLHGYGPGDNPLRCVAAGAPLAVAPAHGSYSFRLHVPDREDLVRARLVIYLSHSGKWKDHTRVAVSEALDFAHGPDTAGRGPIVVRDQSAEPPVNPVMPTGLRIGIAAVWLLAAALAFRLSHRGSREGSSVPWLAILLVALALWELGSFGTKLTDMARRMAQTEGFYGDRRHFQQAITSGAAVLVGVLTALAIRRTRRRVPGAMVFGVCLFAVVTVAELLSLHEVDRFLALRLPEEVPLGSFAHAAAALSATAGMLARLRSRRARLF